MKLPLLLLALLVLAICCPPLGHGARHRHRAKWCYAQLRPVPRVLRTTNAADRPKVVRTVQQ